jgi:MacB-like periplasmic core domain
VRAGAYDLTSRALYGTTSYPDFVDWCQQNHFFASLAAYEDKTFNLGGASQPEHVKGEVVSSDFFETLGIRPDKGRSLASARNQQAAVLSYSLRSRSFGSNPHAIGRSFTLDGIFTGFHSTIIRSDHSTSETKIAGLPNFAPH